MASVQRCTQRLIAALPPEFGSLGTLGRIFLRGLQTPSILATKVVCDGGGKGSAEKVVFAKQSQFSTTRTVTRASRNCLTERRIRAFS